MGFLKEPSHIALILIVVVVLFGSRRLPDAARGLGRSMRIFNAEVKQIKDDDAPASQERSTEEQRRSSTEPGPIEGRVIRDESTRAGEVRRDV